MKNTGTWIIIAIIIAVITGMLFLSDHYRKEQLEQASKEMKEKNALQVIIDSTKNADPVFNSSLKGKIVVISMWTAQNGPCRNQVPDLNKLVKDFSSDKTVFIAVDPGDSANEVAVMKEKDIRFDYHVLYRRSQLIKFLFLQSTMHDQSAFQSTFPANIVLNADGGIEFYYTGSHEGQLETISNYLAAVTGKTPQP